MIGLMGKSKGQVMRIAAVLHVLFCIDEDNALTPDISAKSVEAAIDLVAVCNEHTKIFAGRMNASASVLSGGCKFKTFQYLSMDCCNVYSTIVTTQ